ncbi:MAG: hypothetical protein OHK93_001496 [Ramalina farinacea]|uniref:Cytochrome P450 n=1 Tax=Ramalina farinacea TaxID=258253 RepID=A0AA43QPJ9_9LECA|nr:hypothetical protein [Ramalina farinacea]
MLHGSHTIITISRIPLTWAVFTGKSYDYTDRVHEHYGPIVRVGPTELTIRTSAAWKDIYMHRPQIQKESANQTQPVNRAQSLLTADELDHPRQRRILSHAFSDKAIREQEQLMQPYFSLLISRVRRDAEIRPGKKVDMSKWFNYITLDVMGDLSFGESFHLLENDEGNPWVTDLFLHTRYGHVTANLSSFPLLHWIVSSIFLKLGAAKRGPIAKFVADRIARRAALGSDRPDFMHYQINRISEKDATRDDEGLTRAEVATNAIAFIMAGSKLPGIVLTASLYYTLQRPDIYQKLCDEVRTTFHSEADINFASTTDLKYVLAILNEAMRLHHPTPAHLARITPPSGHTVDGHWIPGNTTIGMQMNAAYHSPDNFVEPLAFLPERWLPNGDFRFSKDNKEVFQPFSAGPRNCIGQRLGYAEMRVVLARMIWNFDLELGADKGNINYTNNRRAWIMYEDKALMVKVMPRAVTA